MSYNTRRTGAAAGRQAPTTQVNYHQQPNRPGAGSNQPNRNTGYTTSQPPVNYNSSSQPAFTTTPPLPPAQPKTSTTPQQQQQAPPPPSTPATKQQPVTPANTPNVKEEPLTPATPADTTNKMDTTATENGGTGENKAPFWKKRPFVKVSNKVRRARQNAKLRRMLNPKNALTFLNELRPGTGKFAVREDPQGWGYIASVEIDGKTFTGHGLATSKARMQASEKALKYLLLEQLSKSQQAASEVKEEDEPMETDGDGEEKKGKKQKPLPEDEVPWGSLAAFALHKLFMEWQKEGPLDQPAVPPPVPPAFAPENFDEDIGGEEYYARRPPVPPEFPPYRGRGYVPYPNRGRGFSPYPAPRGPPPPGFGPPGRRPPPPHAGSTLPMGAPQRPQGQGPSNVPMKSIPPDANQRHPVMLLNQLKPNIVYNETQEGQQPRVTFVITIELDGQKYVGRGKNKKEAKKQAAKAALAPMGIYYGDDV